MTTSKISKIAIYTILIIGLFFIFIPFYLVVVSSFKTPEQMSINFFSLPKGLYLENFKTVFSKPDYFMALKNSFVITFFSLAFMAVLLPMASYPIARRMNDSKFYRFMYYFMVAGIFVPFQVKMMPLVKLMNGLGLLNRTGIIILYIAGSTCEGVFLFVGYLSSLPDDIEEAAYIDGASTFTTFFKIIYPLLVPMIATMIIKNGLWVWNDFFMPMLILNKSAAYKTLPLFQYTFKTEYAVDYNLAFTAFLISMIPVMVLYVFMQKKIIGGMMSGAVKG